MSLHITDISSKLPAYETSFEKMSITNTSKFETSMKENEELLNTKSDGFELLIDVVFAMRPQLGGLINKYK